MVKGRRQNVVQVTLEGEGKLGLVFAKDSEPPQIKEVKPGGLAAKVRRHLHYIAVSSWPLPTLKLKLCRAVGDSEAH